MDDKSVRLEVRVWYDECISQGAGITLIHPAAHFAMRTSH